jgi:hypothetical protein
MATKLWVGTDSGNEGDYSTAANWSPSGVPVATDDVILANSSQDITAGLDQSAVALTSFTVDLSYTGLIGSSDSDFLEIAASTVVIGQRRSTSGNFTGSKRFNLDLGSSTAAQVKIYGTASKYTAQHRAHKLQRANRYGSRQVTPVLILQYFPDQLGLVTIRPIQQQSAI